MDTSPIISSNFTPWSVQSLEQRGTPKDIDHQIRALSRHLYELKGIALAGNNEHFITSFERLQRILRFS